MRRHPTQRGSSLMVAIIVIVVLAAMGAAMTHTYQMSTLSGVEHLKGGAALNLADAVLNIGLQQLADNQCNSTGLDKTITVTDLGAAALTVTPANTTGGTFTLTATETGTDRKRSVSAVAECSTGPLNPSNCAYHINSLAVSNNGKVNVARNTDLCFGSVALSNNVEVKLTGTQGGVIWFVNTGGVNFNNNLQLNRNGDAKDFVLYPYGAVLLDNNAEMTGLLIAPKNTSAITVRNNAHIIGALATLGTVNISNNAYVNTTPSGLTKLGELGVSVSLNGAAGTTHPIAAVSGLTVGNNAKVNGNNISGGSSYFGVDSSATRRAIAAHTLPTPETFPTNSGSDGSKSVGNNGTLTLNPGHYTTVSVANNATLNFTAGSGGGGSGKLNVILWRES